MRTSRWWFVLFFSVLVFVSRTSAAQQAAANTGRTGVGLGAEATTTGIVGATFVYDASVFRIDALLGADFVPNETTVATAGRFFFPLHRGQMADFSIGPGIGLVHTNIRPPGDAPNTSRNDVHLEGAVQIRAFVVPNVAFSASAGLGMVLRSGGNTSGVIGGQLGGSLGVTYFFW
jgi:hypothetical protein